MILSTLALLILDSLSWGEIGSGIVFLFVAIWALKSGIPQQLFTTTNSLLEKRTVERDDALRERDAEKKENEELEEQIRILRREIISRIDISREDQDSIKELKQELKQHRLTE